MLREVSLRTATVASARNANDAATAFVLELPLVAAAATGVLPPSLPVMVPKRCRSAGAGALVRDDPLSWLERQ